MGCFRRWLLNQKLGDDFTPKMDGENNGNPYFLLDDLGVPLFLETPRCFFCVKKKHGRF